MADGTPAPHKKVFIKTYGCQMNVYDSDRMFDVLKPEGYAQTDVEAEADLIVLNTCHIREKATEKVYSALGRIRSKAKKRGTNPLVAVAGCVAQAEGAEIARRAKNVDLVIGPQSYQDLPMLLVGAAGRRARGEALDFDVTAKFKALKGARKATGPSAMVSVQEGCDKFCTFCVVPYTRGAEVSRDVDAVVAEVRDLVHQGVRDITLLGQNVNAYHGVGPGGRIWSLAQLLRHLAQIDGLDRLRYMTSHPRDMDDDLIAAHGDLEKLMPYLHLPIQSGSDRVLDAMNRRHTADDYLRIIDRLKQARPDLALSSDFIVGFPGETDAEFEDTMALVRAVTYASAFSFKYSPRPGTPAADDAAQIPEDIKDQRLYALQELLGTQTDAFNAAQIGQTVPILMDKPGKFEGQIQGRSPYLQSVYIDGVSSDIMGQIVPVRILSASRSSLKGERV
jgi:tRNA-2-methylthio-N6-dimethylallyladenosine synthase